MSSEEKLERRVDCIEMYSRVKSLEHWRDGNGAKGAEQRLQSIETKVNIIIIMLAVTVGENLIGFVMRLL